MGQLADLLKHKKVELQLRLKHFMQMVVASFEPLSHAPPLRRQFHVEAHWHQQSGTEPVQVRWRQ
jgi:hypothetical protein